MVNGDFKLGGKERSVQSSLVPIGGKLPYYLEAQTDRLLDLLINIFPNSKVVRSQYRTKINSWLYTRRHWFRQIG